MLFADRDIPIFIYPGLIVRKVLFLGYFGYLSYIYDLNGIRNKQ